MISSPKAFSIATMRIPRIRTNTVAVIASAVSILAALTLGFASCAVTAEMISPDWTQEMFFKNAQQAMHEQRFKDALFYYDVFLIRYPEDYRGRISARYEKAFIHYKIGNLKTAEDEFLSIIALYDGSPYAILHHPRFRRLSEIGLQNIAKSRAVNDKLLWRFREKKWAEEQGDTLLDGDDSPL